MAARPLEDHLIAVASGRLIDNAGDAEAVDRNKTVDVGVVAEQSFDAAQIAEFFLADGADEQHVTNGFEFVRVHRLDQRQHRRQPARVVADAGRQNNAVLFLHGDVGAFRKYGVEMRRDHELGPAAAALAQADHIAFRIDRRVLEAQF
jgi:hypothetical protein